MVVTKQDKYADILRKCQALQTKQINFKEHQYSLAIEIAFSRAINVHHTQDDVDNREWVLGFLNESKNAIGLSNDDLDEFGMLVSKYEKELTETLTQGL